MSQISVIIHDIRSTHNVGAILRTCDGFGITKVYIGGYSPYPLMAKDDRLPHISAKLTKDIHKTALGAEKTVHIELYDDLIVLLKKLHSIGATLVALEQTPNSIDLRNFDRPAGDTVLLLGREVEGIDQSYIRLCDFCIELPMLGKKESFNVSVAAGIAMYALCATP